MPGASDAPTTTPPAPANVKTLPPPAANARPNLPPSPPVHSPPPIVDYPPPQPPTVHVVPTVAVQVNVHQTNASHSLGVAALVLGVVSLVAWCVPGIGIVIGGLGALLGFLGLTLAILRKGRGIGYSIAGTALSCIGLIMGIAMTMAVKETFDKAMTDASKRPQAKPSNSVRLRDDSERSTQQEPPWNDARQPLALGDAQFSIVAVQIGKVPVKTMFGDESESEDELLTVWYEVKNTSERKKIDYRGWMQDFPSFTSDRPELTDDSENRYRRSSFGASTRVVGAEDSASIYPGKTLKSAIVFELPVDGAKYLRLQLPGDSVGEEGEFRFKIPASMISRK